MWVFDGIADLKSAVGTHLGFSDWPMVTQKQIDGFLRSRATSGGFISTRHQRTVRRYHRTWGISRFHCCRRCWSKSSPSTAWEINYGADKLRFPAGHRLRARVELSAASPSVVGHQVRTRAA